MFHPLPPPSSYSLEELQNRIRILKSQDFLPIFGKKRNAAIGESIEIYLGLKINNSRSADWGDYELKSTSKGLTNKISLFNITLKYQNSYTARDLVLEYGKPHHSKHLGVSVIRLDWDVKHSIKPLNKLYINITIEDINENLNQYNYSQLIPIEIYSGSSALEFIGPKWINGTTSLIIPIENIPNKVRLNYIDFVLVQFSDYNMDYIETTDITVVNVPPQQIPGYNILIIIFTFSILGLIVIYKKPLISQE